MCDSRFVIVWAPGVAHPRFVKINQTIGHVANDCSNVKSLPTLTFALGGKAAGLLVCCCSLLRTYMYMCIVCMYISYIRMSSVSCAYV